MNKCLFLIRKRFWKRDYNDNLNSDIIVYLNVILNLEENKHQKEKNKYLDYDNQKDVHFNQMQNGNIYDHNPITKESIYQDLV